MRLVCLDPGHGGRDPGACYGKVRESEIALRFAQRLGHYIRANGGRTAFTREDDRFVSLFNRGQVAKLAKADLFVSIHCNAASTSAARGCEAFYAAPDKNPTRSIAWARVSLHTIAGICAIPIRGVKPDNASQHKSLTVLRSTYSSMPAILLELGFLTNNYDRAAITNTRNLENLAASLGRKMAS